jgi:cytochrome c-type biogenesis protein CcmF
MLLVNNLLLTAALAGVFIGTLYPLAYEWLTGGRLSVGPPFFNAVFVPLMVVLSIALGAAPFSRWKQTSFAHLWRELRWVALGSAVLGVILPLILARVLHWQAVLATTLGLWILLPHVKDLWQRAGHRWQGLSRPPRAHWGMFIAHVGFAAAVIGVGITSHYSVEQDVRMTPGQPVQVGERVYTLQQVRERQGPNFIADRATIEVQKGNRSYMLYPEKRHYFVRDIVMTQAAIRPRLDRDIYVALGDPLGGGAWSVRVHDKPMVRWIWLGALLMAFGGVWAVLDKRYQRRRVRDQARLDDAARGCTAGIQRRRRWWYSCRRTRFGGWLMKRLKLFIPLGVFLILVGLLYAGFSLEDPSRLPSTLIGRDFPAFQAAQLEEPSTVVTESVFGGRTVLVNVWATWCPTCKAEHAELQRIHEETGLPIIGINYKDDADAALAWLDRYGSPYEFNISDPDGRLGIELGVYGAPETFVVDADGRIQFKWVGDVNRRVWNSEFLPVLQALEDQAAL